MERGIFVPMMIPAFPDNPCGGGGTGTVTSVALTAPAIFAVANSPVTTAGSLDITLVNQSPNLVFASPTTAPAAPPTFRTLVAADLGTGTATVNTVLRGDMTWGDATAIVGWTPSLNTSAPNNTVNASRLLVNSTSVNGDAVIQPKGTGALLGDLPDGTSAGGNKRGIYAVDLQLSRGNAANVASGNYSAILGGNSNGSVSPYTVVVAGDNNTISVNSDYSSIVGGQNNIVSASSVYSTIVGGTANNVSNTGATIVGGSGNAASGLSSFVGAGQSNTASGSQSSVVAGIGNTASGIGSGVPSGTYNTASGDYSVAQGNNATADRHSLRSYASYNLTGAVSRPQVENQLVLIQTTTSTSTILTTNGAVAGASNRLTIANDSSYAFHGIITARRADADNESAMWEIKGGIDNNAGTTALVGCPSIITLGDDSSGVWTVTVDADDTNDALQISVVGQNTKTINWACALTLMKVTG